jgi:transposase-like protein
MAVVQDGWKITEVAQRLGVARQRVHNWIALARFGRRRSWLEGEPQDLVEE